MSPFHSISAPVLFVALVVPASVVLSGCYGKKTLRQPITVEEIASDVSEIRAGQADLKEEMDRLEVELDAHGETIRTLQAENQYLYKELEQKLSSIDAKLQDVIGRSTGYSGSGPYWSGSASDGPAGSKPDWTGAADEPATAAPPREDAPPTADGIQRGPSPEDSGRAPSVLDREYVAESAGGTDGQSKRVYDQAYLDLTRGNYSLAILGFKEFLRRVPDSDLSDNAQYWIGESYYMQGDFRQAVREYGKVMDMHGGEDRVPSALYKLGLSKLQLGDRAEGIDYLRDVYSRFPESEEARLARDKLDSLN